MKRGIRFLSRAVAVALLLSAGTIPPAHTARTPITSEISPVAVAPQDAVATRYEVRLRKLHLVRPDLIPYPIHYDVYC
jgi:hypothetical protein